MRFGVLRTSLQTVAILALTLLVVAAARALPDFQAQLFAAYPNAALSLGGCIACHHDSSARSFNPFGQAFFDNDMVFDAALEALDSDGDGATNGEELRASPATSPGDPSSWPGVAPPPGPVATDGPALYGTHCASCHQPLATSTKRGATITRVQNAIAGNMGGMGYLSALSAAQLDAIVAALASAAPAAASSNHTGLWWKPSESGWGLALNHQGDTIFAALFTYAETGSPLWLVMSAGQRQADGLTYSGTLYRVTGPAFNAVPFNNANASPVGTMSIAFASAASATLSYTYNGVSVTKSVVPQVFGSAAASCAPTTAARTALTNYQDLWWNPAEPGWGVSIAHQNDMLFAALFTYDLAGKDLWLVMSAGARQADGSYRGDLFTTRGPAFNAQPFTPLAAGDVTKVGQMRFAFADGNTGTLDYTMNGVPVTKSITRQVFASAVPACTSPSLFEPATAADGAKLYSTHCASCHQPLASSSKGGASLERIQNAIAGNVGGMGYLSSLSSAQLAAIVAALSPLPPATPACGSCHAIPPPIDGHAAHNTSYTCNACHGDGYGPSSVNAATHNNGLRDVLASLGWNATNRTCAGGCHGPATWSSTATLSCTSCHGTPPATGGHARHSASYSCDTCHGPGYSATSVNAATHRNGTGDTLSSIGWNSASATCANSCHGTATWSPTATLSCTSCHGIPPATGDHARHSTRYSCATCHGPGYGTTSVNAATHRNGIKEILAAIGWNASSTSCANSCHGTGSWSPTATLSCTSCHGVPPSTGHHRDHRSRSCDTCHGAGYTSTTVNAATHYNGVREVAASTGWNPTSRSCSNSCHGRETW